MIADVKHQPSRKVKKRDENDFCCVRQTSSERGDSIKPDGAVGLPSSELTLTLLPTGTEIQQMGEHTDAKLDLSVIKTKLQSPDGKTRGKEVLIWERKLKNDTREMAP